MKLYINAKLAFILTLVTIVFSVVYFENIYHVLPLILISILWMCVFYKTNNALKRSEVVFERVDQLKIFSVELQTLINNELALVQDDVIRTQKIVSDSINILQDSTLEISNNILSQQNYLEKLSSVMDKDNNNPQEINSDGKKRDVLDVNENILSIVDGEFENLQSIEKSLLKNKSNLDNMMLALQFEDIVSQISDRVAQHVGDIRMTVDILSRLCESELSTSFQEDIDKMKSEYKLMKEKMIKISSKNLASQKNMDEGDIELF